jgi:hypothetical protein
MQAHVFESRIASPLDEAGGVRVACLFRNDGYLVHNMLGLGYTYVNSSVAIVDESRSNRIKGAVGGAVLRHCEPRIGHRTGVKI